MLRLSKLGGLVLHQDGSCIPVPRPTAGRDRLLALLRPGSEAEAARHSLYQALHAIRRSLGGDDVFLGSTTLQLNPERMTSDVAEFLDAAEEGAHERAVRLYRGGGAGEHHRGRRAHRIPRRRGRPRRCPSVRGRAHGARPAASRD